MTAMLFAVNPANIVLIAIMLISNNSYLKLKAEQLRKKIARKRKGGQENV